MTLVEALRALCGPEAHLTTPDRRVLASERIDEELKRIAQRVIREEHWRNEAVQLVLLRLLDIAVNAEKQEDNFVDALDPDGIAIDIAESAAAESRPERFGGASDAQAYVFLRTAMHRAGLDLRRSQCRLDQRFTSEPPELPDDQETIDNRLERRWREEREREILAEMDLCRDMLERDVAPAAQARMRKGGALTFVSTFEQLIRLRDRDLSMNDAVDAELGSTGIPPESAPWLQARDRLYARFKRARKDLVREILRRREAEELSERRKLVFLEVLKELVFRTPNGQGRRRRRQMREVGDVS